MIIQKHDVYVNVNVNEGMRNFCGFPIEWGHFRARAMNVTLIIGKEENAVSFNLLLRLT